MYINCKETSTHDIYRILIGTVIPRPIAWVSTVGLTGVNNLAPFSFFNCFGTDPPILAFAPAYKSVTKSGGEIFREPKDTLRNIIDTKEFVVNIVSEFLAEQMNQCAAEYPADVSEFEMTGLTAAPATKVKAPLVKECLVNFECTLIQVIQHGNNNMVLGEIVSMHIDDKVLEKNGHINRDALKAVGRMAGNWYTTTTDGDFEIVRPKS